MLWVPSPPRRGLPPPPASSRCSVGPLAATDRTVRRVVPARWTARRSPCSEQSSPPRTDRCRERPPLPPPKPLSPALLDKGQAGLRDPPEGWREKGGRRRREEDESRQQKVLRAEPHLDLKEQAISRHSAVNAQFVQGDAAVFAHGVQQLSRLEGDGLEQSAHDVARLGGEGEPDDEASRIRAPVRAEQT